MPICKLLVRFLVYLILGNFKLSNNFCLMMFGCLSLLMSNSEWELQQRSSTLRFRVRASQRETMQTTWTLARSSVFHNNANVYRQWFFRAFKSGGNQTNEFIGLTLLWLFLVVIFYKKSEVLLVYVHRNLIRLSL